MSSKSPKNATARGSQTVESTASGNHPSAIDSNARTADATTAIGPSDPSGAVAVAAGCLVAALFYAVVVFTQWAPLERYFMGHPVAIAATVLFCIAAAILTQKFWLVRGQWSLLESITDASLSPNQVSSSPSDQFRGSHDAGFIAGGWLSDLAGRSYSDSGSRLLRRLREVLTRQTGRGTTKHLSDDLRELSSRDADNAHDSFALIRIIVWAIPMLGFLGTVIGITQTLGGLDFSNGNAAVDNLKSGLYVAFDTTALGLVLSVVAIFLQFPVEKSEQQLLAAIDERVAHLTSLHLPGDDAADNQFELLAQLCDGVRAAVAESLDNQTKLWRHTIDEAQGYWVQSHNAQAQGFIQAVEETLTPALRDHAGQLEHASARAHERLDHQFQNWQSQLSLWQESILAGAEAMSQQHATMLDQTDQAMLVREQASSVLNLQQTLTSNIEVLNETNRRMDENMGAAAGQGMADAMIVLARAVDVLTKNMPTTAPATSGSVKQRQAA